MNKQSYEVVHINNFSRHVRMIHSLKLRQCIRITMNSRAQKRFFLPGSISVSSYTFSSSVPLYFPILPVFLSLIPPSSFPSLPSVLSVLFLFPHFPFPLFPSTFLENWSISATFFSYLPRYLVF